MPPPLLLSLLPQVLVTADVRGVVRGAHLP